MADSAVPITSGLGTNIDTRTESTNSHHRQVIVAGDPSDNDGVAGVVNTAPASSAYGVIMRGAGTMGIYVDSASGTIRVKFDNEPTMVSSGKDGTTTRPLRMNSDGAVKIYDIVNGTVQVSGITNSIGVYIDAINQTIGARVGQVDGTVAVYFSPAEPTIKGITNSIGVYVDSIRQTIGVRVGQIDGTVAVYFSPSEPTIKGITNSIGIYMDTWRQTGAIKIDPDYNITQKSRSSSGTYNKVEMATFARQIIAANALRKSVLIVHDNSGTLYIGFNNSLTSANIGNGFPLVANQILGFDDYTGAVFGVLEANPSNIKYLEL